MEVAKLFVAINNVLLFCSLQEMHSVIQS